LQLNITRVMDGSFMWYFRVSETNDGTSHASVVKQHVTKLGF